MLGWHGEMGLVTKEGKANCGNVVFLLFPIQSKRANCRFVFWVKVPQLGCGRVNLTHLNLIFLMNTVSSSPYLTGWL